MKHSILFFAFSAIACILSGCSSQGGIDRRMYEGDIKFACDETFANVLEQHVFVFTGTNPEAHIDMIRGTESDAVNALLEDSVRLIALTRQLTSAEKDRLLEQQLESRSTHIAVDAVAFVVNKDNPDSVLTTDNIRQIMTGEVTQWSQLVPGSDLGKIQVIFDNRYSSTVRYVIDSICSPAPLYSGVSAVDNNLQVVREVARRKNAIGVIGAAWVDARDSLGVRVTASVAPVRIKKMPEDEAYGPFQAYIASGKYPYFRSIYMIKTESYNGLSTGFTIFVAGQRGQKIFEKTNISPARIEERIINVSDKF